MKKLCETTIALPDFFVWLCMYVCVYVCVCMQQGNKRRKSTNQIDFPFPISLLTIKPENCL